MTRLLHYPRTTYRHRFALIVSDSHLIIAELDQLNKPELLQMAVAQHYGSIWIESSNTNGSTFCFTMPGAMAEGAKAAGADGDLLKPYDPRCYLQFFNSLNQTPKTGKKFIIHFATRLDEPLNQGY